MDIHYFLFFFAVVADTVNIATSTEISLRSVYPFGIGIMY
jgi:hypothetical protein